MTHARRSSHATRCSPIGLAALPRRRALLQERAYTLARVLGVEDVCELDALGIERVVDGNVNSCVYRLSDGCDGERRLRCDPVCELEHLALQLARRYDRVDQAEGEGPLGVDRVAR